jgi:hypothetical protein
MLNKYKIKFENDGLTITQWIEPGTSRALPTFSGDNSLNGTFDESQKTNASVNATNPAAAGSSGPSPEVLSGGSSGESPEVLSGGSSGPSPEIGTGPFPGSATAAPITIIGPIIYMCCPNHNDKKEKEG